jgi:homospermidine synthase
MVRFQPDAFISPKEVLMSGTDEQNVLLYFSHLHFYGYGDVIPITGARSFATLISATGQPLLAIIIALICWQILPRYEKLRKNL